MHFVAVKCNYSYRNACHFSAAGHEREQHEDELKYIFSSSRFKHPHSNFLDLLQTAAVKASLLLCDAGTESVSSVLQK